MEAIKTELISDIIESGALMFGEFETESGRISPYFFNIGYFNTGHGLKKIGYEFASEILTLEERVDINNNGVIIFGPAYKGIPIAVATTMSLHDRGIKAAYAFNRKKAKDHGEASLGLQNKFLVGAEIKDGSRIIMVEDVFSTGKTKYNTIKLLNKMVRNVNYLALIIALDRQELDNERRNAMAEFTTRTNIPVRAILKTIDIYKYLIDEGSREKADAIANYLQKYGTEEVRRALFAPFAHNF